MESRRWIAYDLAHIVYKDIQEQVSIGTEVKTEKVDITQTNTVSIVALNGIFYEHIKPLRGTFSAIYCNGTYSANGHIELPRLNQKDVGLLVQTQFKGSEPTHIFTFHDKQDNNYHGSVEEAVKRYLIGSGVAEEQGLFQLTKFRDHLTRKKLIGFIVEYMARDLNEYFNRQARNKLMDAVFEEARREIETLMAKHGRGSMEHPIQIPLNLN